MVYVEEFDLISKIKCEALQRIPHEARGLQGICREKAWYPLLV